MYNNFDNELKKTFDDKYIESALMDLISETDFSDPSKWSISALKSQLYLILRQEAGIEIDYEKDALISESGLESIEVIIPKQISIYYIDIMSDSHEVKRKKYIINDDITS